MTSTAPKATRALDHPDARAILTSPEGWKHPAVAEKLATMPSVSVAAARDILASIPREEHGHVII